LVYLCKLVGFELIVSIWRSVFYLEFEREHDLRMNFCRTLNWFGSEQCWIDLKFEDLGRTEVLTVIGIPVIVRMLIFWTDSSWLHCERSIKGAQKDSA